MNKEKETIVYDQLFLGLAKPQTLLGAPYMYTLGCGTFTAVLFIGFKNPLTLTLGIPLILFGRWLVKNDPYKFQTIAQFSELRGNLARQNFWHTDDRRIKSISPLHFKRGKQ